MGGGRRAAGGRLRRRRPRRRPTTGWRRSHCRRWQRSSSASWFRHRRAAAVCPGRVGLFGAAALVTARGLHLALAGAALAAALVLAALVHRERWVPLGAVRDYLALTKPRIMSLLLLTGFCGLVAGAGGLPPWEITVTAMRRPCACLRRRERTQPRARQGHRPAHGPANTEAASGGGPDSRRRTRSSSGSRCRRSPSRSRRRRERPDGGARARRQPLLRLVYTGWLKRSTPQNIVIGGAAGAVPPLVGWAAATGSLALPALGALPHRLPVDATALLGARAADQARLRGGGNPDAARRARRRRDAHGRSSSTRSASSHLRSSRSPPAGSVPCTSGRRSCWGRSSSGSQCGCGARSSPRAPRRSSITRCSTSHCSSSPPLSTRWCI